MLLSPPYNAHEGFTFMVPIDCPEGLAIAKGIQGVKGVKDLIALAPCEYPGGSPVIQPYGPTFRRCDNQHPIGISLGYDPAMVPHLNFHHCQ
jgi:hypothetical protein